MPRSVVKRLAKDNGRSGKHYCHIATMEAQWTGAAVERYRVFVAVAECGGFSAAAQRLGVSSSHVSRQVAALEERLQTRLFYRSTRQVALTEIGKTFLQHCRQLQEGQ